jgi:predicted PurR-regulated permease PerM
LLAVAAAVLVWLMIALRSVLLQFLIAIILATGLAPLKRRLQRLGLPNLVATLLVFIGLLLLGVGIVALLLPALLKNTEQFIAQAPSLARELQQHLQGLLQRFPFLSTAGQELAAELRNLAGALAAASINMIGFASSAVLSAFLTLLMTFYLLADGTRIREYLLSFLPWTRRASVRTVTDRMGERMGHWLLGQLLLCLIIGGACTGVLLLLGVPGALVLGVIAGVLELIPNIGPFLAAIPAFLVALTQSPLLALATVLAYWGIQALENAVLVPKLMGRVVKLHPLAVILALSVGGTLFGVTGALIAIPVTAALAVLLEEIQGSVASRTRHDTATSDVARPPLTNQDETKAREREEPFLEPSR